MATFGKLSVSQERLAIESASGKTIRDAAAAIGMSQRTAYRHWANPEFKESVVHIRNEAVSAAVDRMTNAMSESVDVLEQLLSNADPNVRLRAASKLLDLGFKADDTYRLSAEIEELRQLVAARGNQS
jgi:AcrR family transcriptional regulator